MMRAFAGIACAFNLAVSIAQAQMTFSNSLFFPLLQNANTTELFPMPPCGSFKLEEATIDQMQAAMSNGTLTSRQLVVCYLERAYQTEGYIK
jgi:amidase